jgi:hypothetical protein
MSALAWHVGMFAVGLVVVLHAAHDARAQPRTTKEGKTMETTTTAPKTEAVKVPPDVKRGILATFHAMARAVGEWIRRALS